jgi:hypothetical protein
MRINLAYILSALLAIALVALVFTFIEVSRERYRLKDDLKNRSSLIAGEFNKMQLSDPDIYDRLPEKDI